MLTLLLEFLLIMDSQEIIFSYILNLTKRNFGDYDLFLECLEPFIMMNIIKLIPECALKEIISSLANKGEYLLIEKLITSINIDNIEISYLINLCIEKSLFKGLIHCCTTGQDHEFMMPISISWAKYLKFMQI